MFIKIVFGEELGAINRNRHLKKFIYRDDGLFNINNDLII